MTTLIIILAYVVSPFLAALAVIQILRRLRRTGGGVPPVKGSDAAEPSRDRAGPEYLANQLERLMALPLTTAEDRERWEEERNGVQQHLEERFPQFEPEHEVWHFFDDADIRARDAGYRDRQHGLMTEYVRRLRRL
jgi:hypothetical protein